jgi:hypothetical protein
LHGAGSRGRTTLYGIFTPGRRFLQLLYAGPPRLSIPSLLLKRMQISMPRARQLSLALLIFAAVEYGHLHIDHSGARPGTLGLTRLQRDLARRGNNEFSAQAFTQHD